MNATHDRAKSIFLTAAEIASPNERRAFIEAECAGDDSLRGEVEELLRHQQLLGSFLESPAADFAIPPPRYAGEGLGEGEINSPPLAERPGTVIGPYKLLEQIGEGGFGVVFLAEQERPVKRRVALKIIKPGMDTRQVVARFEAERQALAMMDHPNIAKVLDAGTTDSPPLPLGEGRGEGALLPAPCSMLPAITGRPYFVMELVQGVPITEYCDECNLTTRERLELFIAVCQAVQHAHQKGVIHRDIKPTNVLVAMQDGRPAPKIIDFGVAKAINQRLTEHTLATGFAQMVGTPLYMSPEQAELSPLGVDTRSDIYSLGVLLYELLTGATPFDKDRLHAASYDELRRIIREEEPPRPSARISTLAANIATTVAERRRTDTRRLLHSVRGDLDWIVMKCLEKDRNRRYETASALALDVQHYLADEPVQACPPSRMYRLRKLARRYRGLVTAATLLAVAMLFSVGMLWNERSRTLAAFDREKAERHRAEVGMQVAMESVDKMVQTLVEYRWIPQLRGTHKRSLEESISLFDRLIELDSHDAHVYVHRGLVHEALGEPDKAVADHLKALELDPNNHLAHFRLAYFYNTYQNFKKRDYKKALHHIQRAVELAPDVHRYRIDHAFIAAKQDLRLGLPLFEEAIKRDPLNSDAYSSRADMEAEHGKFQAALDDARKALKLDPENYEAHRQLGRALAGLGRFDGALDAFERAEDLAPFQHYIYRDRGDCLLKMERYEDAVAEFTHGLRLAPQYWYYHKRLAGANFELSRFSATLHHLREAMELVPSDLSTLTWAVSPSRIARCPDEGLKEGFIELAGRAIELNDGCARAFAGRGQVLAALGRFSEAESDFARAVKLDPHATDIWFILGFAHAELGSFVQAASDFRRAWELNPDASQYLYYQALSHLGTHDDQAYRRVCREMLDRFAGTADVMTGEHTVWTCALGPNAVDECDRVVALSERTVAAAPQEGHLKSHGAILYRAGRFEEAIVVLTDVAQRQQQDSAALTSPAYTWYILAMAHHELGYHDEASSWLIKANEWTEQVLKVDEDATASLPWNRRLTLELLRAEANSLIHMGEPDSEAEPENGVNNRPSPPPLPEKNQTRAKDEPTPAATTDNSQPTTDNEPRTTND